MGCGSHDFLSRNKLHSMSRSPRISVRRLAWLLSGVVVFLVLARAAWVASRTEGGWEILRDHLIGGLPPFLRPAAFCEYSQTKENRWRLQIADDIETDPKSTAAHYMGAALVVGGFDSQPLVDPLQVGDAMWAYAPPERRLNREVFCSRSEILAAKAVALEPMNLDWRRLLVLRIVSCADYARSKPIDSSTLSEIAIHDPDNSLYEYLMGFSCFERAWGEIREVEG